MSRTAPRNLLVAVVAVLAVVAPGFAGVEPVKSHKDIKFPPIKTIALPQPERVVLANGMVVYLLEDHRLPVVKAKVRVRTGLWWEPAGKPGVGDVMADVMRTGGAGTLTGDQLDEELEALSASIETVIATSSMDVNLFALKGDAVRVLGRMAEMLKAPRFDQKKIDLQKIQMHADIDRRNDALGEVLSREMRKVLYGKTTPMARVLEHDDVDRLTQADVVAFYRSMISPDRMTIAVWGDFEAKAMQQVLAQAFGGWTPSKTLAPVPLPKLEPPLAAGRVFFVDRPDAAQAHVRLGHVGGFLKDAETPALEVANEIFGGGMASRLFFRLRTKNNLAYSVGSGWGPGYLVPGTFLMVGETKAETTGQFIASLKSELADYLAQGPTEDEVQHAKETLLNALPFSFEDPGAVVDRIMTYEYFGYPKDFLTTYMDALKRVTRAQVHEAMKLRWHPDKLHLFVLGNAAKFDKPLSTFGKVETLDVSIPPSKAVKQAK